MHLATELVVHRPVWRSYRSEFLAAAATHVRAGGFAAVFDGMGAFERCQSIKLLLPRRRAGGLTEMAQWALLALEIRRWGTIRTGLAKGLASVRLRREHRAFILEWCERDSGQAHSTYAITLDCLQCAACCRDNRVVLEPADRRLWRRAQRDDLDAKPYIRTLRGVTLLRLAPDGRCLHLGDDQRCAIYRLRPANCRTFPVGSEACLAARLDTLGIVD